MLSNILMILSGAAVNGSIVMTRTDKSFLPSSCLDVMEAVPKGKTVAGIRKVEYNWELPGLLSIYSQELRHCGGRVKELLTEANTKNI